MASSSNSKSSDRVPFSHTAAGHAGISTSADGSLLIKPCTPSEIAFYESARQHTNFQAHMPVYMGSLTLNDSPEEQAAANALRNAQTRRDSKGAEDLRPVDPASEPPKRRESGHIVSDPMIKGPDSKKAWTPSGGAKLSSNLSIVLSNATAGFVKPNIIDLKLGARLWDDNSPLEKRARLDDVAKASTSGSLGFRVAGMKVYVGDDENDQVVRDVNTTVAGGYKTFDKMYGRSNIVGDGSNINSAFGEFLYSLSLLPRDADTATAAAKAKARRTLLLQRLLREVESIQFALENEESRMYSASILIVYEGDPNALDSVIKYTTSPSSGLIEATPKPGVDPIYTTTSHEDREAEAEAQTAQDVEEEDDMEAVDMARDDDDDEEGVKQKIHEVVLIDFAHAKFLPGEGPDENALRGIRNVRLILEGMLAV